jgi:hypothetical protein
MPEKTGNKKNKIGFINGVCWFRDYYKMTTTYFVCFQEIVKVICCLGWKEELNPGSIRSQPFLAHN